MSTETTIEQFDYDFFFSYHHVDKKKVAKFAKLIGSESNIRVFFDELDIKFGDNIQNKLQKSLIKSRFVLVFLSPRTTESKWPSKEFIVPQFSNVKQGKIIPILLENCEIPFALKFIQRLNCRNDSEMKASSKKLMNLLETKSIRKKKIENRYDHAQKTSVVIPSIGDSISKNDVLYLPKITNFVGRDKEIEYLCDAIPSRKFISIRGFSGVGKTQLAYQVIENLRHQFDRIIIIHLNEEINFKTFLNMIDANLSIPDDSFSDRKIIERIRNEKLHKNKILIFCDSFDLIGGNLEKIENQRIFDFLKNTPKNTTILLTSNMRKTEFVREKTFHLKGLDIEEGYLLFKSIIQKNGYSIPRSAKTKAIIQKIIKNVDGHPLALSLLANSYNEKTKTFENMLMVLSKSSKKESTRRSIDQTILHSINNLDKQVDDILLKKFSLFTSCFPNYIALNFLNTNLETIELLQKQGFLVRLDNSNAFPVNSDYWIYEIPELVRKHLGNKYDEKLIFEERTKFFDVHHNFLRKIILAINNEDTIPYQQLKLIFEGENDFENLVKNEKDHPQLSSFCHMLGTVLRKIDFTSKSLEYHNKSLSLNMRLGNMMMVARDYVDIALTYLERGQINVSLENLDKSIKVRTTIKKISKEANFDSDLSIADMNKQLALSYTHKGQIYRQLSQYDKALENLEKSLSMDGSNENKIRTYVIMGSIYRDRGDFEKALKLLMISQHISQQIGNETRYTNIQRQIAIIYRLMGKYHEAFKILQECVMQDEKQGNVSGLARDYLNLAMSLNGMGKFKEATSFLQKSISIDHSLNLENNLARDYTNQGIIFNNNGNLTEALEYFKQANKLHEKTGNNLGSSITIHHIGITYGRIGFYDKALEYLRKSAKINERLNNFFYLSANFTAISKIYLQLARLEEISSELSLLFKEIITEIPISAKPKIHKIKNKQEKLRFLAKSYQEKATELSRDKNDEFHLLKEYYNKGIISRELNKFQNAIKYFKDSLLISKRLNNQITIAKNYLQLGITYREMNQLKKSLEFLSKSVKMFKEFNDEINIAKNYLQLGITYMEMNQLKKSLELIQMAREIDEDMKIYGAQVLDNFHILKVLIKMHDMENALEYYNITTKLLKKLKV